MAFTTASISNVGGRAVNEDHCGSQEVSGAGCWVVADGLGGHGGGSTASRLAVDTVLASFRANPAVTSEALWTHLSAAHAAILQHQGEPSLSQMRSTVVVLLADGDRAVCGHMGDSRLYQFRQGAVEFQTADHSVPGALAASGAIQNDDIRFHEDRNRVLRSLGNDDEIKPSITERPLRHGDAFLLCTDGFWEYVTELEMEADAAKTETPNDWLRDMASRLLRRAKAENDNWTAMAIFFQSPRTVTESGKRPAVKVPMSLLEKVSWGAVAFLTVTLLVFVAVIFYPRQVVNLPEKTHHILAPDTKPAGKSEGTAAKKETTAQEKPVH